MREPSSICVYCGSSTGADPAFAHAARQLGTTLADQHVTLVYGGGAVGLMGELADAALVAGGQVRGVIPRNLFRRDVPHQGLTELIEVDSMHERKQRMFELADAFVALPGGMGTLEELTEMATWAQLGLHHKPIATVDVNGYWSHYHALRREAVRSGFLRPEYLSLITEVDEVDHLLAALRDYSAPRVQQLIDMGDT
ncbi:MAG TPA: TIGR00730 family Rossman fold protein [Acidimicrobiales bacterium]|nr:TIGR00730 family Rossman fold protein [Acidimicrobiales bacterium]